MEKRVRFIDLNEVEKKFKEEEIHTIVFNFDKVYEFKKIVRCKDCTWWKSIFSWNGKEHKVCVRESAEPPRESDDYCSYGKEKN